MGRLADDLYLIMHDERTGRCRLSARAAGLGLAGAILAELLLDRSLAVHGGRLFAGEAPEPPEDRLLREVLASLDLHGGGAEIGEWLRFLAIEAADDLRVRMSGEVLVKVMIRGVLGRRRQRHVPVNPNTAVWPAIRLAKHLSRGLPMPVRDQVLVGLVEAVGLLDTVLWLKPDHEPGWDQAALIRQELPVGLGELVAHADAAVGQGVLAGRSA